MSGTAPPGLMAYVAYSEALAVAHGAEPADGDWPRWEEIPQAGRDAWEAAAQAAIAVSESDPLRVIAAAIEAEPSGDALIDGASVLAYLGAAYLKKVGFAPDGKADVLCEIDEDTVITITWKAPARTPRELEAADAEATTTP